MKNTRMLMLVILIAGCTAAVISFWDLLTPFVLSAVIACLLSPLVERLARATKWKRGVCVAVVIAVLFTLLGFLISRAVPPVAAQATALVNDLRRLATGSTYEELIASAQEWLGRLPLPQTLLDRAYDILNESDGYILSFLSSILSYLVSASMGIVDWVIGIVLTVYFLLDGRKMVRAALAYLPDHAQVRCRRILRRGGAIGGKYIKSRLIISSGMAVVTFIGLRIIGMPYAAVFALLSFFLDFIPYFGSILAALIEGFVALLTGGAGMAVTVLIFVLIVQQIEGNVIAPRIEGDATGIHPVTVMFSLLACNRLWGPVGMLFSTPLAAVLKIVLTEAMSFIRGDDAPPEPEPPAKPKKSGWSAIPLPRRAAEPAPPEAPAASGTPETQKELNEHDA